MVKHSKIESAILELTGQRPVIDEKKDQWMITLGVVNPFQLAYRKHPRYTEGEHRYGLLITLLESIVNLMNDPVKFEDWVNKNAEQ